MKSIGIGTVLAVLVFGTPLLPLFAQDSPSNAAAQAPAAGMMQSCAHHEAMAAALADIEKLVADNKRSTDIAKLQNALSQIGAQVVKVQESSTKCSGMMEMMEKMGTMKSMPEAGAAEHKH